MRKRSAIYVVLSLIWAACGDEPHECVDEGPEPGIDRGAYPPPFNRIGRTTLDERCPSDVYCTRALSDMDARYACTENDPNAAAPAGAIFSAMTRRQGCGRVAYVQGGRGTGLSVQTYDQTSGALIGVGGYSDTTATVDGCEVGAVVAGTLALICGSEQVLYCTAR